MFCELNFLIRRGGEASPMVSDQEAPEVETTPPANTPEPAAQPIGEEPNHEQPLFGIPMHMYFIWTMLCLLHINELHIGIPPIRKRRLFLRRSLKQRQKRLQATSQLLPLINQAMRNKRSSGIYQLARMISSFENPAFSYFLGAGPTFRNTN